MPPVRVDVAPVVLDWVIKQASDAVQRSDVMGTLLGWKAGIKKPTFNQVASVSKATGIPLGYFFLKQPPVENFPVLEYRTIDSISSSNPSRNLIDTINHMESAQEWMRNYMVDNDYDKLNFVSSVRESDGVDYIANNIRKTIAVKEDWYQHIKTSRDAFKFFRKKLESIGVLVMMNGIVGSNTHRKLNIDEFRAFTIIDDYAPLIFINANDSNGAKLFSLLHECAHIWLGKDNFFNDRFSSADDVSPLEVLCNAVAAEVLVPNSLFTKEWNRKSQISEYEKIKQLSNLFNCGTVVIARRALSNSYISKDDYQELVKDAIEQFNKFQKKTSKGGNYYATAATRIDHRFIAALDYSIQEGKTQFTDAYRLTNTSRKTFSKLVDQVRGIGQ